MPATFLVLLAVGWLGCRTLLLLAQVGRHSPEARLSRAFSAELRQRGLVIARHELEGRS
jgi:hypothetical protein